jgi:hypothetical protein
MNNSDGTLSEFSINVRYYKNAKAWTFKVYVDGREVANKTDTGFNELISDLSARLATPLRGTKEWQELLEWQLMNPPAQQAQATSSKPQSQVKRYSTLLKQIDADGLSTRRINKFNDTTLDLTLNTTKTHDLNLRIVYDPAEDDYELITNGRTSLSGCDYEKDILPLLIAGGIINNTNLCESAGSIADDFKLYENFWNYNKAKADPEKNLSDKLTEWVYSTGNKVTTSKASTVTNAKQTTNSSLTDHYKELFRQILECARHKVVKHDLSVSPTGKSFNLTLSLADSSHIIVTYDIPTRKWTFKYNWYSEVVDDCTGESFSDLLAKLRYHNITDRINVWEYSNPDFIHEFRTYDL